jgi:hypothetical protein
MSSVLLGDGIGYFAIVMVGHALNFYFSRSSDAGKQGSFFTFNVALSSILSQKISKWRFVCTVLVRSSFPQSHPCTSARPSSPL